MKYIALFLGVLFVLLPFELSAQDHTYTAVEVTNTNTGETVDTLVREATPLEVYQKHIEMLNSCDWAGLMGQYPDQFEIHFPGANIVRGREAAGELFGGFVLPFGEGGLCGLTFTEESRYQVGTTMNVQWVANAPFLVEPYRGSDAYVTDDGLLVAIVTTFNAEDLQFEYTAAPVTNSELESTALVREDTSIAVYEKHIQALNECDWVGIMGQYPDQFEIHFPGANIVRGREAAGELFGGFVLPFGEGGLCGLTFVEESRYEVAGVLTVQWVANAPFLAEPYRGSDAYVTDDGLLVAIVTTFDAAELVFAE